MASSKIIPVPDEPVSDEAQPSWTILKYANGRAGSLLETFDEKSEERGRGATSDEQQDLLRVMVVYAAAGLESAVKELVGSAIPRLIAAGHDEVRQEVQDSLKRGIDDRSIGSKGLAGLLLGSPAPQSAAVEFVVGDLTSGSLQSVKALKQVAKHLGLPDVLEDSGRSLQSAFICRNSIVHEMDINLSGTNRKQHSRRRDVMVPHAEALLKCGFDFVAGVDKKLR